MSVSYRIMPVALWLTAGLTIVSCSRGHRTEQQQGQKHPVTSVARHAVNKTPHGKKSADSPTPIQDWTVEGPLAHRIKAATVTGAGGRKLPVRPGSRLVLTMLVTSMTSDGVTVRVTMTGASRTVLDMKRTLHPGHGSGLKRVGLAVDTSSLWPEGPYTLEVSLDQPSSSLYGRLYTTVVLKDTEALEGSLEAITFPYSPRILNRAWIKGDPKILSSVTAVRWKLLGTGNSSEHTASWHYDGGRWALVDLGRTDTTGASGLKAILLRQGHDQSVARTIVPPHGILSDMAVTSMDGTPRIYFLRQESGIVRFSVHNSSSVPISVYLMGPDGIYSMTRTRHTGPKPFMLTFTVPEFATSGRYRFHIVAGPDTYDVPFEVRGPAIRPTRFRAHSLALGRYEGFLSDEVNTVKAPGPLLLSWIVEGFRLSETRVTLGNKSGPAYEISIRCQLTLRHPLYEDPIMKADGIELKTPLLHAARAARMKTRLVLPALKKGRYMLQINCADQNSRGEAMLVRQVEVTR